VGLGADLDHRAEETQVPQEEAPETRASSGLLGSWYGGNLCVTCMRGLGSVTLPS
jgi:hypothetical protein